MLNILTTQGDFASEILFPEITREKEGKTIEDLRQKFEEDVEWKHLWKHLPDVHTDVRRHVALRHTKDKESLSFVCHNNLTSFYVYPQHAP